MKEYLYTDVPNKNDERIDYLLNLLHFSQKELSLISSLYNKLINIKYTTYKFILYIEPEATPRPRYSKRFHTFYVAGSKDNGKFFKEIMKILNDLPVIITPTKINIETYLPMPKNMTRIEKYFAELKLISAIGNPDWDNLAKTYCDMIQHGLLLNDNLIFSGKCEKYYSIKPRVEITISFADDFDCKYNKNKIEKSKSYKDLFGGSNNGRTD